MQERSEYKIVFMGTPEFAVPSLSALVDAGYDVCAVVTATDKPAGRGRKISFSAIKEYAIQKGLKLLQPENLKSAAFYDELKGLNSDLGVVVAFRMLPEQIWNLPKLGTINLHASLLPDYRGAAPINRAIMQGETKSGISTFFLRHEIDTGPLLLQQELQIGTNETAGELHDRLMSLGANLVLKTVDAIREGVAISHEQRSLQAGEEVKSASKLFRDDCKIDWTKSNAEVHNHIRGLSPFPGAWTILTSIDEKDIQWKILNSEWSDEHNLLPGQIKTDMKNFLSVGCGKASISVLSLQSEGKKRMSINEFLRGSSDLSGFQLK